MRRSRRQCTIPRAISPDRFLPDKAIDLIDEAASRVRIKAYHCAAGHEGAARAAGGNRPRRSTSAVANEDFERAARLRDDKKAASKRNRAAKAEKWEQEHSSGRVEIRRRGARSLRSSSLVDGRSRCQDERGRSGKAGTSRRNAASARDRAGRGGQEPWPALFAEPVRD